MKVKIALRFRGREMAHTEFGFQVVNKFLAKLAPYGHPDHDVRLVGRSINVMISPLPRNKRAKHPHEGEPGHPAPKKSAEPSAPSASPPPATPEPGFNNNPFNGLNLPGDPASQ
jgi:translation initiation factor IF-3